jgi:hypothetical protein
LDNKTEKYITILTSTYPNELAVIRGRIEAEGIECFLQDELTVQVNPFYSNAIGGVKLQVKESDLKEATEILRQGGYIEENDIQPPKFISNLDRLTSKIPLLNRVQFEIRLMIIIAFSIGIIATVAYFTTLPTIDERLTKNSWCVDNVIYNGKTYTPQTNSRFTFTGTGICEESITFRENGTVTLPGFQSETVWGKWGLGNESLQISQTDTFSFVYNGVYKVDFSSSGLILKSEKTTLHCHAENINIPF